MSKLFFLALLGTMVYFFIKSLFKPIRKPAQKPKYKKPDTEPATEMVQDPICGLFIDPKKSLTLESQGLIYYFCSEECESKFLEKIPRAKKI